MKKPQIAILPPRSCWTFPYVLQCCPYFRATGLVRYFTLYQACSMSKCLLMPFLYLEVTTFHFNPILNLTKYSVQFSSVTQSCPTLCDPMNCSTPGLPVHHQLPEFTQTHVHQVSDAIQPSHPLSSPSPPAPNLSQHQSLFQWVNYFAKYYSLKKKKKKKKKQKPMNQMIELVSWNFFYLV